MHMWFNLRIRICVVFFFFLFNEILEIFLHGCWNVASRRHFLTIKGRYYNLKSTFDLWCMCVDCVSVHGAEHSSDANLSLSEVLKFDKLN